MIHYLCPYHNATYQQVRAYPESLDSDFSLCLSPTHYPAVYPAGHPRSLEPQADQEADLVTCRHDR